MREELEEKKKVEDEKKKKKEKITERKRIQAEKKNKKGAKKIQIPGEKKKKTETELSSLAEAMVECVICGDTFGRSKSKEKWVQCNFCLGWAHNACTGHAGVGVYICDVCQESTLKERNRN